MRTYGLRGVEMRHLVALDAIATHGGFGAAALALGYTQSAVSQQIATLEKRLGERLVERGGGVHRIAFTPAGTLLCRHAREMVRSMSVLEADLAALDGSRQRSLRVGVFQSAGARIIPHVMAQLAGGGVGLDVSFANQEAMEDVVGPLASGELDIAFTHLPRTDAELATMWVLDDPWFLVVAAGDPLASRRALTPAEEAAAPVLGYDACRARVALDREMAAVGAPVTYASCTDDNGMLQGLAAAGVGHALMPQLSIDPFDSRVVAVPIRGVSPRQIGLAWHPRRALPEGVALFVEATRAACAALSPTAPERLAS